MATLDTALMKKGETMKAVERWKADMPVEQEMVPKDKYSIFDRKERKYRKGIHSKFTLGYFELCGRAISDEVKEKVYSLC